MTNLFKLNNQHINMHSFFVIVYFVSTIVVFSLADIMLYTSNGYALTLVNNDPNFDQDTRQRCIDTFFNTLPQMCDRFNRNSCTHDVTIIIDPTYNGVAYASGATIVISATWFQNNPQDTDVITHEGMHIVQAYPSYDPSWLVEGIADYARWKYGINNQASGWSLPDFDQSQHYTNSYRVTARFLVWCEERYPEIVNQLDAALRSNTYSINSWNQFANGESVDQLWSDYSNNPNI